MPLEIQSPSSRAVGTENPKERAVVSLVPGNLIDDRDVLLEGTKYKDAPNWMDKSLIIKGYGDYEYFKQENGDGGIAFYFGKPKTNDSNPVTGKYTPFRITTSYGDSLSWPPILQSFQVIADYGAPRAVPKIYGQETGIYIAPTYYAQVNYIPDTSKGTKFQKFEYLAPTPFQITRHPAPVPTSVNVMVPGREAISFPECLHATIKVDRMITSIQQVVAGLGTGSGSSIPGQVFPSTEPFETWRPYVLQHDQKLTDGGWYCWKVVAYPPDAPDPIIRKFS